MNDFLRNFIMKGIKNMIERGLALYQVYKYSAAWYDKGVLLDEDLVYIEEAYQAIADAVEDCDI